MAITPAELLTLVEATVDKEQAWTEALILEKLGFNWGVEDYVAAGEYTIVFPQPYATGVTDYEVWGKGFIISNGRDVGFKILDVNKTNISFKVWVSEACRFAWKATEPKVTVPL